MNHVLFCQATVTSANFVFLSKLFRRIRLINQLGWIRAIISGFPGVVTKLDAQQSNHRYHRRIVSSQTGCHGDAWENRYRHRGVWYWSVTQALIYERELVLAYFLTGLSDAVINDGSAPTQPREPPIHHSRWYTCSSTRGAKTWLLPNQLNGFLGIAW